MDLLLLLPSMSFPFDTVKMLPEGLMLSKCSCAGTARYFIPRAHVDYVTTGRELWIKTLLAGVALLIAGAVMRSSDSNNQLGDVLFFAGIAVVGFAVISMLPQSMTVASNSAVFVSTKCINDADALMQWMRNGPSQSGRSQQHEENEAQFVPPRPVQVERKQQRSTQRQPAQPPLQRPAKLKPLKEPKQSVDISEQAQEQHVFEQQMHQQQQLMMQQQQQQHQQMQQQVQMYPHPPMAAAEAMPSYAQAQSQYSVALSPLPPLSSRRAARPLTPRIDSPSLARPELLELAVPGEIPSAPLQADASASYDQEHVHMNMPSVSEGDVHIIVSPHHVP